MVHVRSYVFRICFVCSRVNKHIPHRWSNQRLVESRKLNSCLQRSSLYAYKHGRDMQTARFSRCLILKRYTEPLILLETLWFSCTQEVDQRLQRCLWICVGWMSNYIFFRLVIITAYDKITVKTGRPILMSVFRMCSYKWLPQICASERVCLVYKGFKVNILFNSCKSFLAGALIPCFCMQSHTKWPSTQKGKEAGIITEHTQLPWSYMEQSKDPERNAWGYRTPYISATMQTKAF